MNEHDAFNALGLATERVVESTQVDQAKNQEARRESQGSNESEKDIEAQLDELARKERRLWRRQEKPWGFLPREVG